LYARITLGLSTATSANEVGSSILSALTGLVTSSSFSFGFISGFTVSTGFLTSSLCISECLTGSVGFRLRLGIPREAIRPRVRDPFARGVDVAGAHGPLFLVS
jgi:hypothetical protein